MSVEFLFNVIEEDSLDTYAKDCHVFNNTRSTIEADRVLLASFEDERLGSSLEKLDIAVYNNNSWKLLNIEDKIKDFNEIPVGYLLGGVAYSKVLIIIRKMSNMLLDKCKSSISTYIYNVVDDNYAIVEKDDRLYGILAKNGIFFNGLDSLSAQCELILDIRDRAYVSDWVKKKLDEESEG